MELYVAGLIVAGMGGWICGTGQPMGAVLIFVGLMICGVPYVPA